MERDQRVGNFTEANPGQRNNKTKRSGKGRGGLTQSPAESCCRSCFTGKTLPKRKKLIASTKPAAQLSPSINKLRRDGEDGFGGSRS
jgi:hypothetical protein